MPITDADIRTAARGVGVNVAIDYDDEGDAWLVTPIVDGLAFRPTFVAVAQALEALYPDCIDPNVYDPYDRRAILIKGEGNEPEIRH